jgi:hypothetical protein
MSRLVERYKMAMAVQLRNVIGYNWGWFSREDQRMHIQVVDPEFVNKTHKPKVWLEVKGKRAFIHADGDLSNAELKKLKAKVDSERGYLESKWIWLMVRQRWIKAETDLIRETITITAYPNTHNKFTRVISLREYFPGVQEWANKDLKVDFDDENGMLRVGTAKNPDDRDHIPLWEYLFKD